VNTKHPKWKDALRVYLHAISKGRLIMVPGHDPDTVCVLSLERPPGHRPRFLVGYRR